MTWANNRWHTTFFELNRIMGYYGPIPPMRDEDIGHTQLAELQATKPQEYDL
jgi:hypothetical protein